MNGELDDELSSTYNLDAADRLAGNIRRHLYRTRHSCIELRPYNGQASYQRRIGSFTSNTVTTCRIQCPATAGSLLAGRKVDWNPVAFVEEQGYDEDDAITRVITLTGTGTAAQAAFPAEYLEANWPLMGKYTVKLVKSVVSGPGSINTCEFLAKEINLLYFKDEANSSEAVYLTIRH
jgi:hypothetical protein